MPELLEVKQRAQDLLTIFSETCDVRFFLPNGKVDVLKGRWCTVCKWAHKKINWRVKLTTFQREDEVYIKKYGKRKTFHVGSNSSCRQHIRRHYTLYQERCARQGLKEHHHAVPRAIAKERKQAKQQEDDGQRTLDGVFRKASKPNQWSKDVVLKAVAEFVVCDDQVQTCICLANMALY